MPGALVPLVLLPRFTGFVNGTFKTVPLDVNDYANAIVNIARGPLGAGSSFYAVFEESTDQISWTICGGTTGGFDPADGEAQVVAHLQKRWFRIRVGVSGSGYGVTCWAVGGLERR